jgi:hypothetical protein
MNKTGGRRKMFLTRENAASFIKQLLSPLSSPFFGVNCFMTMGSDVAVFLSWVCGLSQYLLKSLKGRTN